VKQIRQNLEFIEEKYNLTWDSASSSWILEWSEIDNSQCCPTSKSITFPQSIPQLDEYPFKSASGKTWDCNLNLAAAINLVFPSNEFTNPVQLPRVPSAGWKKGYPRVVPKKQMLYKYPVAPHLEPILLIFPETNCNDQYFHRIGLPGSVIETNEEKFTRKWEGEARVSIGDVWKKSQIGHLLPIKLIMHTEFSGIESLQVPGFAGYL
jgi:hypothetical protein